MIYLGGRYLFVPVLRIVAKTGLRELFTASSLLLVVSVAMLMQTIGMSPALGTFLAGVVLANSEYKHELESDLEPFKGLLLGLFFIGVGASINFDLIFSKPLLISALVAGVMTIKFIVLIITGKIFSIKLDQNILFAFALAQVGEFSFVLLSFTNQLTIISREWMDIFMAVTAITMTLTPLFLLINEKVIDPRTGVKEKPESRTEDEISEKHPVIIAGFGHFGSTIGRFLRANGIESTILDHDSDRVSLLRKMGFKVFYGDATRMDVLKSAGAESAKILIAAVDSPQINFDLVEKTKKAFPNLRVMVRAKSRMDAYELLDMGIEDVYRESIDTSIRLGVDVLIKLGFRKYGATRAGQTFLKYDEAALHKLALHRHDQEAYLYNSREQIEIQEQLLAEDRKIIPHLHDHAWDRDEQQ